MNYYEVFCYDLVWRWFIIRYLYWRQNLEKNRTLKDWLLWSTVLAWVSIKTLYYQPIVWARLKKTTVIYKLNYLKGFWYEGVWRWALADLFRHDRGKHCEVIVSYYEVLFWYKHGDHYQRLVKVDWGKDLGNIP